MLEVWFHSCLVLMIITLVILIPTITISVTTTGISSVITFCDYYFHGYYFQILSILYLLTFHNFLLKFMLFLWSHHLFFLLSIDPPINPRDVTTEGGSSSSCFRCVSRVDRFFAFLVFIFSSCCWGNQIGHLACRGRLSLHTIIMQQLAWVSPGAPPLRRSWPRDASRADRASRRALGGCATRDFPSHFRATFAAWFWTRTSRSFPRWLFVNPCYHNALGNSLGASSDVGARAGRTRVFVTIFRLPYKRWYWTILS